MTRRRIDSVADYLSAFSRGMVLAAAVLVAQSAFAQVPVGPYPSGGVQRVIMPYISGGGVPDGPIFATPGTDCTAGTIPYSYSGDTDTGQTSTAANTLVDCIGGSPLLTKTANVVEQYNSTSAQTYNLYGTRTNATNYERLSIQGDRIVHEAAGSGAGRSIIFDSANTASVQFRQNGGNVFQVRSTAAVYPNAANSIDLCDATNTCRNGYFGTSVVTPTVEITGASFTFNGLTCTVVAGAIACS